MVGLKSVPASDARLASRGLWLRRSARYGSSCRWQMSRLPTAAVVIATVSG